MMTTSNANAARSRSKLASSFKISARSNSFSRQLLNNDNELLSSQNDEDDSSSSNNSNSNLDLRQDYQNAIDCVKQCQTIIAKQQDQRDSKDAQIANLEERIAHLSFELATSKAFEDEHRFKIRRRVSCDDNNGILSPGAEDGNSVVTVEFDRSSDSSDCDNDTTTTTNNKTKCSQTKSTERRGRRATDTTNGLTSSSSSNESHCSRGRLTSLTGRRATDPKEPLNDCSRDSMLLAQRRNRTNHRRKTHDCTSSSALPRRHSLLFGSWGTSSTTSTTASTLVSSMTSESPSTQSDTNTAINNIDESVRSTTCTIDESTCSRSSSRRATIDESNCSSRSLSWFLFRGNVHVSDSIRTEDMTLDETLETASSANNGATAEELELNGDEHPIDAICTSNWSSSASQSIRKEIDAATAITRSPGNGIAGTSTRRRPARARRFERASLKKSLPGVVFPKSFEEVEGLFDDGVWEGSSGDLNFDGKGKMV